MTQYQTDVTSHATDIAAARVALNELTVGAEMVAAATLDPKPIAAAPSSRSFSQHNYSNNGGCDNFNNVANTPRGNPTA